MTTANPTVRPPLLGAVRGVVTSPKYGPVLVTVALFIAVFIGGGIRYSGFLTPQVFLNLFIDNAFVS